jgi:hypothetical protein
MRQVHVFVFDGGERFVADIWLDPHIETMLSAPIGTEERWAAWSGTILAMREIVAHTRKLRKI